MRKTEQTRRAFEWLDLRRLTDYVAASERTLRSWIHQPVSPLPAVRVGGKILVRKSDVDCWLEKHRIVPLESVDVDGILREVLGGSER